MFNDLQEDPSLEDLNATVSFGELLDQQYDQLLLGNDDFRSNVEFVNAIYRTYLRDQVNNFLCPTFYDHIGSFIW